MPETLCTHGPKRLKASQDLGTDSWCRESTETLLKSGGLCCFTPGEGGPGGCSHCLNCSAVLEFTVSLLNCSKDLQYLKPLKLYFKKSTVFLAESTVWKDSRLGEIKLGLLDGFY